MKSDRAMMPKPCGEEEEEEEEEEENIMHSNVC